MQKDYNIYSALKHIEIYRSSYCTVPAKMHFKAILQLRLKTPATG